MIRADKSAHMEDLARQAEEAATRGEQGQVYKNTKLVSGEYWGSTDAPLQRQTGETINGGGKTRGEMGGAFQ